MYPKVKNGIKKSSELGYIAQPKGCFLHLGLNHVYFNHDPKGMPHKKARQVCDAKGNILNYLSITVLQ